MRGNEKQNLTRRGFLRGAGLLGLGGAAAAVADSQIGRKLQRETAAPVGVDLGKYGKIDPKLVGYKEVERITTAHPEPKRVVIGYNDSLAVVAGKYISIYSKNSFQSPDLTLSSDSPLRCVALASDGSIYAGSRETVEVYDPKGQHLASWKPEIKKPWFTSLVVGENELFVADAANRIVHRFDRTGKCVGQIGEKTSFAVPSPYFDLELGRDGLLWVANPGNHRVEAYTFDGNLETKWGEASFGIGGFCGCCNPSYFTLLPDGRFVTSEKGLARVKVSSLKGAFESVVAGADAFTRYFENVNSLPVALDVAADSTGRIYVADSLGGAVRIFERV